LRRRRIVADIVRIDKRHTQGLEPRVAEAVARMMVAASTPPVLRQR
jgi:hypothetical protein